MKVTSKVTRIEHEDTKFSVFTHTDDGKFLREFKCSTRKEMDNIYGIIIEVLSDKDDGL